jgi:hypothetical protein
LATCQPAVPAVPRPGVSMPAVTIRFEKMKADMRKGRRTGSPVSEPCCQYCSPFVVKDGWVDEPGCNVLSIVFFAVHSSGVISASLPFL